MSKNIFNKCQTTSVEINGKVKKFLLFDCFDCEQTIPREANQIHRETDTEIQIVCEDCDKKKQAKKRTSKAELDAIKERLVEEFVKENYKISIQVRDEHKEKYPRDFSTEQAKQVLQQTPKSPNDFNLFMRLVLGKIMIQTETGVACGVFDNDPRQGKRDKDTDLQIWSCKKVKEWGVKNPITYKNKEELLRVWFNKWETFEELFAWLEEDEPCLK